MDFHSAIEEFERQPAVVTSSEALSYVELAQQADRLGQNVCGRKLAFNFCDNSAEAIVGYVGLLRSGTAQALLSSRLQQSSVDRLLDRYRPAYIWAPRAIARRLEGEELHAFGESCLLQTPYPMDYELHEDLALLLSTSGSTGTPKFVRQSYRNIISNARSIADYLGITADDRPITTLPMSYTYGLSIINSHLLRGASIVATNATLMDRAFWSLLRSSEATTFGGVPYVYDMLARLRFERMQLPSLRVLTQAGGKLGADRCRQFAAACAEKGIRFYVMYGQTEATARISYVPWERAQEKAGSIGVPIPGGRMWLEDESGGRIEDDAVGELVYAGDNVTPGYAESRADLALGDENRGVLRTGDMARRDRDGYFYVVGRRKRFLKLFGNRVNLDDVEDLFRGSGFDVACSGTDDRLAIHTTQRADVDRIRDHLLRETNIEIHGVEIRVVDTIPRSSAGKVLYAELAR